MHEHVKFVARTSSPTALQTKEIEQATANEETCKICVQMIGRNFCANFICLHVTELTNIGHTLLRGTRIELPKVLQKRVSVLAHEGHPSIVVVKRRLRSKV